MYQFPHHPFGIMPPLSSWNASLSLLSSGTPLTKGIKNHPQNNKIIKSHKVTYTRITFFPLYPTTIKLTTQQQPKEREKNK
jgi:hypothetical protein